MANKSKKGFNGTPKARDRRSRVVTRLEAQLKSGVRSPLRDEKFEVPLKESDIARIEKELSILKTRI